jgi:hypothetical protein
VLAEDLKDLGAATARRVIEAIGGSLTARGRAPARPPARLNSERKRVSRISVVGRDSEQDALVAEGSSFLASCSEGSAQRRATASAGARFASSSRMMIDFVWRADAPAAALEYRRAMIERAWYLLRALFAPVPRRHRAAASRLIVRRNDSDAPTHRSLDRRSRSRRT